LVLNFSFACGIIKTLLTLEINPEFQHHFLTLFIWFLLEMEIAADILFKFQ